MNHSSSGLQHPLSHEIIHRRHFETARSIHHFNCTPRQYPCHVGLSLALLPLPHPQPPQQVVLPLADTHPVRVHYVLLRHPTPVVQRREHEAPQPQRLLCRKRGVKPPRLHGAIHAGVAPSLPPGSRGTAPLARRGRLDDRGVVLVLLLGEVTPRELLVHAPGALRPGRRRPRHYPHSSVLLPAALPCVQPPCHLLQAIPQPLVLPLRVIMLRALPPQPVLQIPILVV
mmetsp:Transcript_42214/g.89778  ORF Transcript_42214/g.89778 Transcript_42214/m.89778 type:complete len:228 (+) Transcript_42214:171-854(+)